MLTVRQEQVDALNCAHRDRADSQLAAYMLKRFPKALEHVSGSEIYRIVRETRAIAGDYGIYREDNVASFLDFTIMYGEKFRYTAWAGPILDNDSLHGPDKISLLIHK